MFFVNWFIWLSQLLHLGAIAISDCVWGHKQSGQVYDLLSQLFSKWYAIKCLEIDIPNDLLHKYLTVMANDLLID